MQPRSGDSLIGRRVDRSLADAAEQEGWRPGPDRKEPAKKQKQNDLKKKLEAKDALLEEEKKTSAELRVDLERARAYLQSRLDSKLELKNNLQIENDALRKKLSEGRPDPAGVQEELDAHVERCQEMKAKITEMQGEITDHQAAATMVEEDQALVTAKHEKLMRQTVEDANELAAKANRATRRCQELEEAQKASERKAKSRRTVTEAQDIAEEELKTALREKFENLTEHTEAVEGNLTECKKHLEEAEALLKESEDQQREWKQAAITLSPPKNRQR